MFFYFNEIEIKKYFEGELKIKLFKVGKLVNIWFGFVFCVCNWLYI